MASQGNISFPLLETLIGPQQGLVDLIYEAGDIPKRLDAKEEFDLRFDEVLGANVIESIWGALMISWTKPPKSRHSRSQSQISLLAQGFVETPLATAPTTPNASRSRRLAPKRLAPSTWRREEFCSVRWCC